MKEDTYTTILKTAKQIFASTGYEGFSIRTLAKECNVGISSIYHFFIDKDELLKTIFDKTNIHLGIARRKLPDGTSASDMLMQRIRFQFNHIEDIVFVLKYYLHYRPNFLKLNSGYLPAKAYLHIEEVLDYGVQSGEFHLEVSDIPNQSKVIAHAINGYLLEYYPVTPDSEELDDVCKAIHQFLMRSLTNKEAIM